MSSPYVESDQLLSNKQRLAEILLRRKGIQALQTQAIPRRFSTDPLPLSFAQQRMWFLDHLQPDLSIYNVSLGVRIKGDLDVEALERSLNEIVCRHEVLRTTYARCGDQIVQIIAPFQPGSLPVTDLTRLDASAREAQSQQIADEHARTPFDLSEGPILRVRLLRLGEAEHILLICMHHIATDGRAMNIFIRDLLALYKAFRSGEPSPLPELPIQYADYAVWQREWLEQDVLETELKYWKDHLRGMASVTEVPPTLPRPATRTYNGASETLTLSKRLSEGVKQVSRREAATPFMTLLACFKALLCRYTGQEDVIVGTPMTNRDRAETENLIGLLVNTLVLRTSLSGRPNLTEVIRRVKKVVEGAQAHQNIPFERLVEELQPERSSSYSPLFQLMFVMQDAVEEKEALEGLELSLLGVTSETAKFDLSLFAQEMNGRLTLAVEYNTQLYEAAMMRRMLDHMERIIEACVADSNVSIDAIEILDERERRAVLQASSGVSADYPNDTCVHRAFEAQARLNPGATAIVQGQTKLTYEELNLRADNLARRLRGLGVGPETIVAVFAERSPDIIMGLLGVLKAGGAYLPLDPNYPAERIAYILEDAGAKVLLTQRRLLERLAAHKGRTICLDDFRQAARSGASPDDTGVQPDNLAYLIYTSGSTGRPKGVQVQHRSLMNLIAWHQREFEVTAQDRATQLAGLAFDASVWELWPYLTAGASIHLPDDAMLAEPRRLIGWLVANGVTISFLPTPLAEAVMLEQWPAKVPLRLMLTGGDKLRRVTDDELPFKLINNYGPTENTVVATSGEALMCGDQSRDPDIGKPISNVRLYLLDEHMRLAPEGIPSELVVGGESLARGYFNCPELTAEKFVPNPFGKEAGARLYRTGDLARLLADGRIEFLGRIDLQVKIRGFRIELGEIEAALLRHPAAREAVVLAQEDARGEKRLVAYVIPDAGSEVTGSELREFLKQELPDYMVPQAFVMLDRLPLTQNGKVDRRALLATKSLAEDSREAYLTPRDTTELELTRIWEEVLAVERIGVRDNFFSLAGHSLLAVKLMNRVQALAGKAIPLSVLFAEPTIEHLAAAVRQQAKLEFSSLVRIQKGNSLRPFFCVHPAGGNVFCYTDLAHHLGQGQTFYGLQARGLDRKQTPHADIVEMAAYYVELLTAAQPEGPYLLGGWSVGGVIAFEMTQQLQARGATVALLALFDTVAPTHYQALDYLDEVGLVLSFAQDMGISLDRLNISWDWLAQLDFEEQWGYLLEQALLAGVVPPDCDPVQLRSLFDVFRANCQAVRRYVPQTRLGRVTLIQAEKQARSSGSQWVNEWSEWADGGVEACVIPGDHFSIVREPDVKALAECLSGYIGGVVEGASQ